MKLPQSRPERISVLAETIAFALMEEGEAPAGPTYAGLMSLGASYSDFEEAVAVLVRIGFVERPHPNTDYDVLRWVGPVDGVSE